MCVVVAKENYTLNTKLFVLNLCPFCPGADIPVGHSLSRATMYLLDTRSGSDGVGLQLHYALVHTSQYSCRYTEEVDQDYKLYGWL